MATTEGYVTVALTAVVGDQKRTVFRTVGRQFFETSLPVVRAVLRDQMRQESDGVTWRDESWSAREGHAVVELPATGIGVDEQD